MVRGAVIVLGFFAVVQAKPAKPAERDACPQALSEGKPAGTIKTIDGIPMYHAYPKGNAKHSDTAIIYVTDIFGMPLLQNQLLADSYAAAGYLTIIPDVFLGDAYPVATPERPGPDLNEWKARHPDSQTDAILTQTVEYMSGKLGVKRIGGVGYCFGGKFVPRLMAGQAGVVGRDGVKVGFVAHPSFLLEEEVRAIRGPLSVAAGELDAAFNTTGRRIAEDILSAKDAQIFEMRLFSNAPHGFGVRPNMSVPEEKFAKEASFRQAVEWMDAWL